MGAEPWSYFVPYEEDIQKALNMLQEKEFKAGRYRGSEATPDSIEEALVNMGADGTASILDVRRVSESPGFFTVAPLPAEALLELFDTVKPTREMLEASMDFCDDIERGQAIYIIVFADDQPVEIYFTGTSFD